MQVIGILDSASPKSRGEELSAFHRGLAKAGKDGGNTLILYAWANNDYSLLPSLASELVDSKVDVIVAVGGPVSALAAKAATKGAGTPVVFTTVTDPVKSGLVKSLKEPGDNATGTFGYTTELDDGRMKLLNELIKKKAGAIAVIANPNRPYPTTPDFEAQKRDLEAKAKTKGKRTAVVLGAGTKGEIDKVFQTLKGLVRKKEIVGLTFTADPFFVSRRKQIVRLAAELGIPAVYQWPSFVEEGGLMSFGPSKIQAYENAGDFVGTILTGKKAEDLGVKETKKFELVVNDATAKKLRLKIPRKVLGHAVKVIGKK